MSTILVVIFLVCMFTLGFTFDRDDGELKPYQVVCCFFGLISAVLLVVFLSGMVDVNKVNAALGITF